MLSGQKKESILYTIRTTKSPNKLREALKEYMKTLHKEHPRSAYENPAWPFLRAYDDGFNAALDQIIEQLDKGDKKNG